jgi:hypothetical protein
MKSLLPFVVILLTVILENSREEATIEIECPVKVIFEISESLMATEDKKALISTSCEWISDSFEISREADSTLNMDLEEFSMSSSSMLVEMNVFTVSGIKHNRDHSDCISVSILSFVNSKLS